MRGQISIEIVIIVAIIVLIVGLVAVQAARNSEITLAFAAARSACVKYQAQNSSFSFTSIDYSINASNVTFYPKAVGNVEAKNLILSSINKVFHPSQTFGACVPATFYTYCVDFK